MDVLVTGVIVVHLGLLAGPYLCVPAFERSFGW